MNTWTKCTSRPLAKQGKRFVSRWSSQFIFDTADFSQNIFFSLVKEELMSKQYLSSQATTFQFMVLALILVYFSFHGMASNLSRLLLLIAVTWMKKLRMFWRQFFYHTQLWLIATPWTLKKCSNWLHPPKKSHFSLSPRDKVKPIGFPFIR